MPSTETMPEEELRARHLTYGDRVLGVSTVPWMPTILQSDLLRRGVSAVARATEKITDRYLSEPAFRSRFGFDAEREACILHDPGYAPHVPLGRLDLHLYDEELRFLEFNTDGAAGWHWTSAIHALARERLGLHPVPRPLPLLLLQCLLACYRQWRGGDSPAPRIAIVDWKEVPTRSEQQALAAFFRSRDMVCTLEDPRDLIHDGSRLLGSEGEIDLVYRRVISEDIFLRQGETENLLGAYMADQVCMVGSFRPDPAWTKNLFCVLSDPVFQEEMGEDGAMLSQTVPWTVPLVPGEVRYQGAAHDLRELLLARPGAFLLKPVRGYEGRGVRSYSRMDAREWRLGVEGALEDGGWVVQEYWRAPSYASRRGMQKEFFHVGAFVLLGSWAGLMARTTIEPDLVYPTPEVWVPAEMP